MDEKPNTSTIHFSYGRRYCFMSNWLSLLTGDLVVHVDLEGVASVGDGGHAAAPVLDADGPGGKTEC